jgi:hypothetical protein
LLDEFKFKPYTKKERSNMLFYPGKSTFNPNLDGLYGMAIGSNFSAHEAPYAQIQAEHFGINPDRTKGEVQEMAMSRHAPGETQSSGALYLKYLEDGTLVAISLAFGGEPATTKEVTTRSTTRLIDYLRRNLGPEAAYVDRSDEIATSEMDDLVNKTLFTGIWTLTSTLALKCANFEELDTVEERLESTALRGSVTVAQNGQMIALVQAVSPA